MLALTFRFYFVARTEETHTTTYSHTHTHVSRERHNSVVLFAARFLHSTIRLTCAQKPHGAYQRAACNALHQCIACTGHTPQIKLLRVFQKKVDVVFLGRGKSDIDSDSEETLRRFGKVEVRLKKTHVWSERILASCLVALSRSALFSPFSSSLSLLPLLLCFPLLVSHVSWLRLPSRLVLGNRSSRVMSLSFCHRGCLFLVSLIPSMHISLPFRNALHRFSSLHLQTSASCDAQAREG